MFVRRNPPRAQPRGDAQAGPSPRARRHHIDDPTELMLAQAPGLDWPVLAIAAFVMGVLSLAYFGLV